MKKVTKGQSKTSWRWFVGLYLAGVAVLVVVTLLLKGLFGFLAV